MSHEQRLKKIEEENRILKEKVLLFEHQDEVMKAIDLKFFQYENIFRKYEEEKKSLLGNLNRMSEEIKRLKDSKDSDESFSKLKFDNKMRSVSNDGGGDEDSPPLLKSRLHATISELNEVKEKREADLKRYRRELKTLKEQIDYVKNVKEEENKSLKAQVQSITRQLEASASEADKNLQELKFQVSEERRLAAVEASQKDAKLTELQGKIAMYQRENEKLTKILLEKQKSFINEMGQYQDKIALLQNSSGVQKNQISSPKFNTDSKSKGLNEDQYTFGGLEMTESVTETGMNRGNRRAENDELGTDSLKLLKRRSSLPRSITNYEINILQTPQERALQAKVTAREKNVEFLWHFVKRLQKSLEKNIKTQKELEAAYRERVQAYETAIKSLKAQLDSVIGQIANKSNEVINIKGFPIPKQGPLNNPLVILEKECAGNDSPVFPEKYQKQTKDVPLERFDDEYLLPKSDPGIVFRKGDSYYSESDQDLVNFFSKSDRLVLDNRPILVEHSRGNSEHFEGTFGDI